MKNTVQITVRADEGEAEVVQEVACLEMWDSATGDARVHPGGGAVHFGQAGANHGHAASDGVCHARKAVSSLRPGAREQRLSPDRVSHALWQTNIANEVAGALHPIGGRSGPDAIGLFIFLTLSDFQSFAK
jgi:hypothetical protein